MKMKLTAEDYKEKIKEEADFWDKYDVDKLSYGIPHWIDLREATPIDVPKKWPWSDPIVEKILYGDIKEKMIRLAKEKGGRALDIGCGGGWLSLELAREGLEVTGVDIASKRIEIARRVAEKNGVKINYIVSDLYEFDFGVEEYDIMVVWASLHHLLKIEDVLKKAFVGLKKGGLFIILEHQSNFFRDMINIIRKYVLRISPDRDSPFEDVTTKMIPLLMKKYFNIREEESSLAVVKILTEVLYFFNIARSSEIFYSLLRRMKRFDDLLCRGKIINGEMIFMTGNKE